MNPPLRLDAILARVLADRCPGVQACPRSLPLDPIGDPAAASQTRERWDLCELIPNAPRHWSEMPSRFKALPHVREWSGEASAVLGFKVILDCGDNDEVWVVRASPVQPNDQEQAP